MHTSGEMRRGIRIRGERGHSEVRRALVKFARWLRTQYDFPIRVPVYLLPTAEVTTCSGAKVSASFFAPIDRTREPYIRIATGDYPDLKRDRGRDHALAAFITSTSSDSSAGLAVSMAALTSLPTVSSRSSPSSSMFFSMR